MEKMVVNGEEGRGNEAKVKARDYVLAQAQVL